LLSAPGIDVRKIFYTGAHLHIPPKLLRWNFFSKYFSYLYAQTFPPILRVFAIFDHNFVKIAAPTSDEYENYVVRLTEESPVKKTLQTASK